MSDETRDKPVNSEQPSQNEPYEWEKCTVRLSITFFPDDGNEGGRQVVLGCNTHNDPPLIEPVREAELGTLPPIVVNLLEGLKQRLPQQAGIAEAKKQAEIAAAEKARLQRQKTEEKIKAAQRKYEAKNNGKPQATRPAAEETVRTDTVTEGDDSLPVEISIVTQPVNGEQQSLFG
ncbi:MAG: hypothetical protein JNJ50_30905 [Acidobacteria bacterium]|nr:hypothetical protein [Acidobacteriota bacterium]